jgi:RNA polymerase sigma-70 factor (ECF subfamily)
MKDEEEGAMSELALPGVAAAAPLRPAEVPSDAMAQGVPADAPVAGADLERRFEALVRGNFERARRLAWRLIGGDDAAAEDVAQEAFVRAYRGLSRFRGDAKLETWFYRILVRQAQNHRRWRAVRDRFGGVAPAEAPDPAPPPAGDPLVRVRIGAAIGALPRGQRDVFVLVHLEGFTVREAAALLGKREGTVKSHLHRALEAMRRQLGDLRPRRPGEQG